MTGHLVPTLRKAAPKRHERGSAANAALIGSGSVVGGVGLLAGGIPGVKSDFTSIYARHPNGSVDNTRTALAHGTRGVARAARRATGGGILGFRAHAHEGGTAGFEQDKREYDKSPKKKVTTSQGKTYGSAETPTGAFYRGLNDGKIGPEKRILRGMKTGRKVAHGALGVGAAAVGTGLVQRKRQMSKADRSRSYAGALVGTGATAAGVSHGAAHYLDTQGKRYSNRAALHVDEAAKIVPSLTGRKGKRMSLKQMSAHQRKFGADAPWPTTMHPVHSDGAPARNHKLMAGVSPEKAREAGRLRGAAAQERHFAEVFHNTARVTRKVRNPAAITALAGAGGLAAMKEKKPVRKGLGKAGRLLRRKPLPVTISTGAPTRPQLPRRTDVRTPEQRMADQARFDSAIGPRRVMKP